MRIRLATEADAEALARVRARALVGSPYPYYQDAVDEAVEQERWLPRAAGYLAGTYHPSYAEADRTVRLAEDGGEIIGFVAGHRSTRMGCDGELQWMFVLPERQRHGVGGRLMTELATWFQARGIRRVIVDAPPENPYRGFYLRHGAVALDGYWLVWEPGS